MQYTACAWKYAVVATALELLGCTQDFAPSQVVFEEGSPVAGAALSGSAGASADPVEQNAGAAASPLAENAGTSSPPLSAGQGAAGMVTTPSAGAGGAATGGAGSSGAGASAAGSGGAGQSAPSAGISTLTFDVTTLSQGGKYSPKNIGAIWVQNSAGSFVKSLELWAKQRRRYLSKYNAAVGATGAVDIVASATLTSHKTHHVSWNLQDRTGARVQDGQYSLLVEVTDYDGPGKWYSIDFDTRDGAQRVMPTAAQYYTSMALQLQ